LDLLLKKLIKPLVDFNLNGIKINKEEPNWKASNGVVGEVTLLPPLHFFRGFWSSEILGQIVSKNVPNTLLSI
jgi:hypothetical protein